MRVGSACKWSNARQMASLQASALQCAGGFSAPIAAGRAVGGLGARRMVNWRAVFGAVIALALACRAGWRCHMAARAAAAVRLSVHGAVQLSRGWSGSCCSALTRRRSARLQELQARGVRTVCVINAGAWENWRPDSGAYDRRVVGSNYAGWQGERWVDIRAADVVRPIVAKRLDLCQSKGFDGVLFDNVDGYAHTHRLPADGQGPAGLQPLAGGGGPCPRARGGPDEHLGADPRSGRGLRLRGQRAVLPPTLRRAAALSARPTRAHT